MRVPKTRGHHRAKVMSQSWPKIVAKLATHIFHLLLNQDQQEAASTNATSYTQIVWQKKKDTIRTVDTQISSRSKVTNSNPDAFYANHLLMNRCHLRIINTPIPNCSFEYCLHTGIFRRIKNTNSTITDTISVIKNAKHSMRRAICYFQLNNEICILREIMPIFFYHTKFKWISMIFIKYSLFFCSVTFIPFLFSGDRHFKYSECSSRRGSMATNTSIFGSLAQNGSRVVNISEIDFDNGNMNLHAANMVKETFGECPSTPKMKWLYFRCVVFLFLVSFLFIGFCSRNCPWVFHHQKTSINRVDFWANADILYEVPVGIIVLLSIFYGSISIIAVIGNCLVIWIVATTRQMQTVTNLFIANLALADVVIGMFVIPFQVNRMRICFFSSLCVCVIVPCYFTFCVVSSYYSNFLHCLHISFSSYCFVSYQNIRIVSLIYWNSFPQGILMQIYSYIVLGNDPKWTNFSFYVIITNFLRSSHFCT